MPSVRHESLVGVLRGQPGLIATLLARSGLVAVPLHDVVTIDSADLGAAIASELRPDGLYRFERRRRTVLVAVLEVQLGVDHDKSYAWPDCAASARRRHRCDAIVVVFTPSRAVAAWARRRIFIGPGAGYFRAHVIGPDEMPAITSTAEARRNPELAALSAIAHGRDKDVKRAAAIAAAASKAVLRLEGERGGLYYDSILASLSAVARKAFDMMFPPDYRYQDKGLRKANAAGIAKGIAKGKAQGKAEGKAEGVLAVLKARGIRTTAEQRARVLGCNDVAQLDRWLIAAATADKAKELFAH